MHEEARDAFERRDLARYRELFAPGLKYQQADGWVIDHQCLMRDVGAQFQRRSARGVSPSVSGPLSTPDPAFRRTRLATAVFPGASASHFEYLRGKVQVCPKRLYEGWPE